MKVLIYLKILIVLLMSGPICFAQDLLRMGLHLNSDVYREQLQQQRQRDLQAEQYRINHLPASEPGRVIGGRGMNANDPQWKRFYGQVVNVDQASHTIMVAGAFGDFRGIFALVNYPHPVFDGLKLDKTNALNALPSGSLTVANGQTYPRLDYGQLYVPVILPDDPAKKAANLAGSFKYWSDQAATGDAQAEYMLGEKYRVGEGVAKDLPKARAWLAKSAAQGFHDAEIALTTLPAQ